MVPLFKKNVPRRLCAFSRLAAVVLEARPSSKVMVTTVWPGDSTSGSGDGGGRTGLGRAATGSAGRATAEGGEAAGGVRSSMPQPLATRHTVTMIALSRNNAALPQPRSDFANDVVHL